MKQRQPALIGKVPKPALNGNDERISALMNYLQRESNYGLSYK